MTKEQLTVACTKMGISISDLTAFKKEIRIIWNDNNAHYIMPEESDDYSDILEIDMANELIVIREFIKGYAVKTFQPFDTIQKLVFKDRTKYDFYPAQKYYRE